MRNSVNKLIPKTQYFIKITIPSLDLLNESAVLSGHLPGCVRHGSVEPEADDQHVHPDHQEAEGDEKYQDIKVGVIREFVIVIVFRSFSVCFPF